ncbi:MAG: HAMP domain-containing protein [Lachnospiraceae bacterium]|nr:HAMP domain-containing protein [Lachnospiraceae bacterium]
MTSILIITVLSILIIVSSANLIFAETFYYQVEKDNIATTYDKINNIINNGTTLEKLTSDCWQITQNSSIRILIVKTDMLSNGLTGLTSVVNTTYEKGETYETMYRYLNVIQQYVLGGGDEESAQIVESLKEQGYVISEGKRQGRIPGDLSLFGMLDNGYLIAMQIPMEGMQATITIFTRFLTYIATVAVMFGALAMYMVSKNFTTPIKEMADVANRVREMDFDAKVTTITPDELGDLGNCINEMSDKLQQTISELKTANNELRKDIDQKTKIDDMRKEFLSHVSHELKTPIALIQGYAEGLRENIFDDEESKDFYLEVIADEAQKMNRMVKRMLELNEIEYGQDKVQIERFDVVELLKNLTSSTDILFQKKDVVLEFEKSDPIYVWADEFMIEEALSNYISNAIHHVCEGGRIKVRFEQRKSDVRIFIYNDGNAIPEEDLEKIWTKFFKVDKARTRAYGGNGIGLSIVAAAMTAHGKEYGVANKENGVEFYLDLDTNL